MTNYLFSIVETKNECNKSLTFSKFFVNFVIGSTLMNFFSIYFMTLNNNRNCNNRMIYFASKFLFIYFNKF